MGLYAGYGAFMLRDLPFDAIEFMAYEQAKALWEKWAGRKLNPGETSLAGAFAGGFTGERMSPFPSHTHMHAHARTSPDRSLLSLPPVSS
jgi:hypothetical protein